MIDWSRIIGFDWDKGNFGKSMKKHYVSQLDAEQVYFNHPLLILPDDKHSHNERRYHALGKTNNARLLHISFTLRDADKLIRVISARAMHHKERIIYEKV